MTWVRISENELVRRLVFSTFILLIVCLISHRGAFYTLWVVAKTKPHRLSFLQLDLAQRWIRRLIVYRTLAFSMQSTIDWRRVALVPFLFVSSRSLFPRIVLSLSFNLYSISQTMNHPHTVFSNLCCLRGRITDSFNCASKRPLALRTSSCEEQRLWLRTLVAVLFSSWTPWQYSFESSHERYKLI